MFVVLVLVVFVILVVVKCVTIVPEGSAFIVERLGQYHRTLSAGLHVIFPFIESIRFRYSLEAREEQISDTCITRDNVPIRITSVVRAQIADPQQAAYASANAGDFVTALVRTHQRRWISSHAWEDVRESTRELEAAVERAASGPGSQAGIKILAIEAKSVERVES